MYRLYIICLILLFTTSCTVISSKNKEVESEKVEDMKTLSEILSKGLVLPPKK